MDGNSVPTIRNRDFSHMRLEHAIEENRILDEKIMTGSSRAGMGKFLNEWMVLGISAVVLAFLSIIVVRFQQSFDFRGRAYFTQGTTTVIEAENMEIRGEISVKSDDRAAGGAYLQF